MARMPRLFVEGFAQHVIQRGNNRSVCFFCEADYAFYLQKFKQAADAQNVQIHAYVLMTNHVHLLVTGPDAQAIPNMMQSLGRSYVRYINLTYQRTGTLWEGRYKSSLVDTSSYSRKINLFPYPATYPQCFIRLPGRRCLMRGCTVKNKKVNALAYTINALMMVDWLKLATWSVMLTTGIGFWSLIVSCAVTPLKLGGVITNPAQYCPHEISDDILTRIQDTTPVYQLSWNELQQASTSRKSTYGFQMGYAIWIYEDLNDPKETLFHEYCHIYEQFFMKNPPQLAHEGWYSAKPVAYGNSYDRVSLEQVNFQ